MQTITLTINGTEYPIESYNYSMHKAADMEPGAVTGISMSLGVMGGSDLDCVMVDGPFDCTLTIYDEDGEVLKHLEFEDAEITSYSDSGSEQSNYSSIYIGARAVEFCGKRAVSNSEY